MLLFKLFIGFYGIAKEALNFEILHNYTAKSAVLKAITKCLTVILTLLLLSTYILMVPFILLRCVLHVYLKIKHGKSFAGFLSGTNNIFEAFDEKSPIITVITIEETNFEEFFEKLKIIVKKLHECNYMFSSILTTFFGYKYFLTNQVTSEDVLSKVSLNSNATITRNDVLKYLEDYKIFGEGKVWDVVAFEQPVVDDNHNETSKGLVFMIRINHSITDAYYMIALFKRYLLDPQNSKIKEFNAGKSKSGFSLDDVYLNMNPLNPKLDEFLYHGSENQFISFFLDEKVEYLQKIKKIKNTLGTSFSDVILAGFVNSASNFMQKKLGKCGNDVSIIQTARAKVDDLADILSGNFNTHEIGNEFALLEYVTPTPRKNISAIEFLKTTSNSCNTSKLSADALLLYAVPKVTCSFLPTIANKIGGQLLARNACLIFTNMSEVEAGTIANRKIRNVFSYSSMYTNQGMMLSTVTYDNRLQVSLVARLKFIDSREDLDKILNNIFVYIDKLYDEMNEYIPRLWN